MIKNNHINTYKSKLRDNRVYCSMAGGIYSTNHDMKVPFIKSEFSSSKIIAHLFRVNNMEGYSGMGDDIIIVCYQIVQLGLKADFVCQLLKKCFTVVPIWS